MLFPSIACRMVETIKVTVRVGRGEVVNRRDGGIGAAGHLYNVFSR